MLWRFVHPAGGPDGALVLLNAHLKSSAPASTCHHPSERDAVFGWGSDGNPNSPPQPQQQQGEGKPRTPSGEQEALGQCLERRHTSLGNHQDQLCINIWCMRSCPEPQTLPAGRASHLSKLWEGWAWKGGENTALIWPKTSPEAGCCGKESEERSCGETWELGPKTCEKLMKSLFLIPTGDRWSGEDFESYPHQHNSSGTLATKNFQLFVRCRPRKKAEEYLWH